MRSVGDWKLGIIGGTGRIACAVVCDLIRNRRLGSGKILLYGRSPEKLKRNLTLIARVHASAPSGVAVVGVEPSSVRVTIRSAPKKK